MHEASVQAKLGLTRLLEDFQTKPHAEEVIAAPLSSLKIVIIPK